MAIGSYSGTPKVELLRDGRVIRLLEDFTFTDPSSQLWTAPKGSHADGASIPRILWSMIGGPLDGKYRDASIIHDFYCSKRHKPWQSVHRVFYEAMLTSGVPEPKALIMYAGVYMGGPRWTDMDVHNASIIVEGDWTSSGDGGAPSAGGPDSAGGSTEIDPLNFIAEPGGKYTYVYSYDISEQDLKVIENIAPAFTAEELPKLETFVDHRLGARTREGNFDETALLMLKEDGIDFSRIGVVGI
jgi:hypothetical protein